MGKRKSKLAELDGRLAGACKTIKELVRERDRLRAALEEIESTDRHMDPRGNPWRGPCGAIARKALANEQDK